MKLVEDKRINEKVYMDTLDNGMQLIIIPKHETKKKYIIWATKFGSNDNHFINPKTNKEITIPDGVAHYLEHKMFEQKNGVDSLYTLMGLGLDANAYTTNDHTAYLFGGTENFYEGLDELMDYVQNPYFTDENVEKERGIIGQEIQMYDDEPGWRVYINAMKCLYKNNPITIDTAGSIESISHITKETLYDCYNTFYNPANMIMVVVGDFEPNELKKEILKRLLPVESNGKIERIYPTDTPEINKKTAEADMKVVNPVFMIGYKDLANDFSKIEKDIAIQIILNSLIGKCSETYQKMYENGMIMNELDFDYEFSDIYSHVLISGESKDYKKVYEMVKKALQENSISEEEFERSKRKILGEEIAIYNNVESIGRNYLQDAIKGINRFNFIESIENITFERVKEIKKSIFKEENCILSVVK